MDMVKEPRENKVEHHFFENDYVAERVATVFVRHPDKRRNLRWFEETWELRDADGLLVKTFVGGQQNVIMHMQHWLEGYLFGKGESA